MAGIVAGLLLAISLFVCLIRRFRLFSFTALGFHLGVLLLIGGGLLSVGREVVTVNLHQETTASETFSPQAGGAVLRVGDIRREFYPVKLRLGIKKGGEKYRLVETQTGKSFSVPGYRVKVGEFIPWQSAVNLEVKDDGDHLVWQGTTPYEGDLLPYGFVLVAYRNLMVKDVEVELFLKVDGKEIAAGRIGPNRTFSWRGYRFFCTGVKDDPYGFPYASIQISRDPGLPLFWAAALIILAACLAGLTPWGKKRPGLSRGKVRPESRPG